MSGRHQTYWRKTLTMSAILLVAWALLLASAFYAHELRDAAGPFYAALIVVYAWYLSVRDRNDPTG